MNKPGENHMYRLRVPKKMHSISNLNELIEGHGYQITSDSSRGRNPTDDEFILIAPKDYQQLQDKLHQQSELLSVIGHDLRSPLGSVKMLLDFVDQKVIDPKSDDFLAALPEMTEAADEAFYLLENLLYYSRIQQQTITYAPQELQIDKLVQKVKDQLRRIINVKNIKLNIDLEKNSCLFIDEFLILIILRNLVMNACKFSPEGSVVEIESCLSTNNEIKITVRDEGVGIPDENMEQVLNPLRLFHTYGTNQEKGNGLGLNICMALTSLCLGTFNITSAPKEGTVVKLVFPSKAAMSKRAEQ